ncbi:cAMP-dependent protein kinase catalytic subunit PRKX-like isoform X1, partial [Biomphalaria pfeifferi]
MASAKVSRTRAIKKDVSSSTVILGNSLRSSPESDESDVANVSSDDNGNTAEGVGDRGARSRSNDNKKASTYRFEELDILKTI